MIKRFKLFAVLITVLMIFSSCNNGTTDPPVINPPSTEPTVTTVTAVDISGEDNARKEGSIQLSATVNGTNVPGNHVNWFITTVGIANGTYVDPAYSSVNTMLYIDANEPNTSITVTAVSVVPGFEQIMGEKTVSVEEAFQGIILDGEEKAFSALITVPDVADIFNDHIDGDDSSENDYDWGYYSWENRKLYVFQNTKLLVIDKYNNAGGYMQDSLAANPNGYSLDCGFADDVYLYDTVNLKWRPIEHSDYQKIELIEYENSWYEDSSFGNVRGYNWGYQELSTQMSAPVSPTANRNEWVTMSGNMITVHHKPVTLRFVNTVSGYGAEISAALGQFRLRGAPDVSVYAKVGDTYYTIDDTVYIPSQAVDFKSPEHSAFLGLSGSYSSGQALIDAMEARRDAAFFDYTFWMTPLKTAEYGNLNKKMGDGNHASDTQTWMIMDDGYVLYHTGRESWYYTEMFNIAVIKESDGSGWITGITGDTATYEGGEYDGTTYTPAENTYLVAGVIDAVMKQGTLEHHALIHGGAYQGWPIYYYQGYTRIPVTDLTRGNISTTAGLAGYRVYVIYRMDHGSEWPNGDYNETEVYKGSNVIRVLPVADVPDGP